MSIIRTLCVLLVASCLSILATAFIALRTEHHHDIWATLGWALVLVLPPIVAAVIGIAP